MLLDELIKEAKLDWCNAVVTNGSSLGDTTMKSNVKKAKAPVFTHGGAKAFNVSDYNQLRRSVLSCLLWEDEFYESGVTITTRINDLIKKVAPERVAALAIEAREEQHLRHIPLFLVRQMARLDTHKHVVADTLESVIQRADELAEFLAIYFKDNPNQPLSAQVKKGLARAFSKFNEYQLAKYDSDGAFKLRDVMFLVHPKPAETSGTYGNKRPKLTASEKLFKGVAERTLATPDTWEVELSAGADKRETFERLIEEKKLGPMAFLKNLRNMHQAGVPEKLIKQYVNTSKFERVLPFRFITAAKYVPAWEPYVETAMLRCLDGAEKIDGKTVLVIDVSGSMGNKLSGKSELTRYQAAAALSILAREIFTDLRVYCTAGNDGTRIHKTALIPARRGFAMSDAVTKSAEVLGGGGIFLAQVCDYVYKAEKNAARLIVFTDEQDCDQKLNPATANAFGDNNYLINIASAKNGIGYGKWTHIDGFSAQVIEFIRQSEQFVDLN